MACSSSGCFPNVPGCELGHSPENRGHGSIREELGTNCEPPKSHLGGECGTDRGGAGLDRYSTLMCARTVDFFSTLARSHLPSAVPWVQIPTRNSRIAIINPYSSPSCPRRALSPIPSANTTNSSCEATTGHETAFHFLYSAFLTRSPCSNRGVESPSLAEIPGPFCPRCPPITIPVSRLAEESVFFLNKCLQCIEVRHSSSPAPPPIAKSGDADHTA